MSKIVVIAGPTASGKSNLALETARKLNGEIISADSMQIYRGLDIGTAKVEKSVRNEIGHFMIDIVEKDNEFSVAEFKGSASQAISDIEKRGKLPIVAGGTGLYIEALLYPFSFGSSNKDESIRKALLFEYKTKGNTALYEKLQSIDPETAARLHPNDIKRIIRALEIFYTTGKTKSQAKDADKECNYDVIFVGLNCDREKLYERINLRVDEMFESGLLDEIKSLEKFPNRFAWQSMQAIGYKEFMEYYKRENPPPFEFETESGEDAVTAEAEPKTSDGEYDLSKFIINASNAELDMIKEKIKKDTRNYAKRQLTWFRKYKNIMWFDCLNGREEALNYIENELKNS